MEQEDTIVVPAWLGPNKLYVTAKGRAYTFGLFALTPNRVMFASDDEMLIDELREDSVFEWPRLLSGTGCRLRTPAGAWIITFGRPFPDAPAPDRDRIEGAAGVLEALHNTAENLSDLAGLSVGVIGDLVLLAQSMSDIKKGRRTAHVVKAALAQG